MKRSRSDIVLALAAGLAAFIVYRLTLAPTVLPADSGEFQFAAPLLGLAHPTGYPLYLLLGKLWTMIVPLGDIALRMNLLSAVFAAAAAGMLYLLGKRLGLGTMPSLLAALILAFSYTFWSQATRAEVYALNSLFTVVLLYLAAPREILRRSASQNDSSGSARLQPAASGLKARTPTGARTRWLVLLFVLGLSLTHHRTVMLLIPALALLAGSRLQLAGSEEHPAARGQLTARTAHPASRFPNPGPRCLNLASWIPYLVAFLLPLLLYLYIPLRGAATPYMRLAVGGGPDLVLYGNSFSSFLALITGSVFRGSLTVPDSMHTAARLGIMFDLLRQQIGLGGIALAFVGLIATLWRAPRVALSLALAYTAVAGFCFIYFIGDISDFFTPSYIIAILSLGAGIAFLGDRASRIVKAPGRAVVFVLATALPLAFLAGNWNALNESGKTETRTAWEAILREPLPQGAILVSNDRDEMTPMWYLQYVESQRRDLVGLFPQIKPDRDFATLGALLDWLLARGQQPYLIKPMPGLEIKYRLQPAGNLSRVTGYAAPAPLQPDRSLGVSIANEVELVGADVRGPATPGGALTVTLYWQPLAPMSENYHVFVQLMTAGGERVLGSDHRLGDVFYPTSVWGSGDVLADRHVLTLPATVPAGAYSLRAGMYRYPSMTRLPLTGSSETMVDLGTIAVP